MTKTYIRRVHKEYVEFENQLIKRYKHLFGTNPSQCLLSQIIVRLINGRTVSFKKYGKKINFTLK